MENEMLKNELRERITTLAKKDNEREAVIAREILAKEKLKLPKLIEKDFTALNETFKKKILKTRETIEILENGLLGGEFLIPEKKWGMKKRRDETLKRKGEE